MNLWLKLSPVRSTTILKSIRSHTRPAQYTLYTSAANLHQLPWTLLAAYAQRRQQILTCNPFIKAIEKWIPHNDTYVDTFTEIISTQWILDLDRMLNLHQPPRTLLNTCAKRRQRFLTCYPFIKAIVWKWWVIHNNNNSTFRGTFTVIINTSWILDLDQI